MAHPAAARETRKKKKKKNDVAESGFKRGSSRQQLSCVDVRATGGRAGKPVEQDTHGNE